MVTTLGVCHVMSVEFCVREYFEILMLGGLIEHENRLWRLTDAAQSVDRGGSFPCRGPRVADVRRLYNP